MEPEQGMLPLSVPRRVIVPRWKKVRDRDMHHLHRVNGVWCFRFSIDQGPKFKGKRIKVSLGTGSAKAARAERDRITKTLKACGVKLVKNNQGN